MKKKILITLIVAVAIITALYLFGKQRIYNTVIDTVRKGYFSEVSEEVTIGEMMNTLCSDSEWEYTPDTETGAVFVTYTGTLNGQPMKMLFFITNFAGQPIFRLNSASINGIYASNNLIAGGVSELDMVPELLYEAYCKRRGK
jgi:hypothetical protein